MSRYYAGCGACIAAFSFLAFFGLLLMKELRTVPCATGWVIADKTILASAAEQVMAATDVKKIKGDESMFRKKVVLVMTCADGRYQVETEQNP